MAKRIAWNKGRSYEEIFGSKKALEIKQKLALKSTGKIGYKHTEEMKKHISSKMKNNTNWINSTDKSGRSKRGRYLTYYFASSWELAYIIYCLDHDIKFERNNKSFDYINDENELKQYVPDFILEDGIYIEIKGYHTKNVELKIKYFPHKIIVLYEKDMKLYLDYVINKHGMNFVEVLRDNKPIKIIKTKREINIQNQKEKYYDLIKNSNIDFNSYGWLTKLSQELKLTRRKVEKIIQNIMPELYLTCYKTKRSSLN